MRQLKYSKFKETTLRKRFSFKMQTGDFFNMLNQSNSPWYIIEICRISVASPEIV